MCSPGYAYLLVDMMPCLRTYSSTTLRYPSVCVQLLQDRIDSFRTLHSGILLGFNKQRR
jgi:hypothetical protein